MKKVIALLIVAFVTFGCGKDNATQDNGQIFNPTNCQRGGTFGQYQNCYPQQQPGQMTSWELINRFDNFPAKVSVYINGQMIVNECSPYGSSLPGRITRSRDSNEVKVFIPSLSTPSLVGVEIIKHSKKCFWWSTYYSRGNVRYTRGTPSRSRPADVNVVLPQ